MNKNSRFVVTYILLPIFLCLIGVILLFNFLVEGEYGFTNLDVRGSQINTTTSLSGELLMGDIVKGSFHSLYDNLGIVSVRFYNQDRDSKDTLIFRLKEEGNQDWYYQAEYKTDQFLPHKLFPFGFPIINNSTNKNYLFGSRYQKKELFYDFGW